MARFRAKTSPTGYIAITRDTAGTLYEHPVVQWNADGQAMIADHLGYLRPAVTWDNLVEVRPLWQVAPRG